MPRRSLSRVSARPSGLWTMPLLRSRRPCASALSVTTTLLTSPAPARPALRRFVSSCAVTTGSLPSVSTSPPVWTRFREHVNSLSSALTADSPELTEQLDDVKRYWEGTYHTLFRGATPSLDAAPCHGHLIPASCEDLLLLLQSLIDCVRAVRTRGRRADRHLADEAQAVVLLLVHCRLLPALEGARVNWCGRDTTDQEPRARELSPTVASREPAEGTESRPHVSTAAGTVSPAPIALRAGHTRRRHLTHREDEDDHEEEELDRHRTRSFVGAPTAPCPPTSSVSSALTTSPHTPDLSSLGLRRDGAETVEAMTARGALTLVQQLHWMVLVDTVFCAVTSPLVLTRGAQHHLYLASLCALEEVEYLPSTTVAALSECLARCAQSHTITQQLDRLRVEHSDTPPRVVEASAVGETASWRHAAMTMDPRPFQRLRSGTPDDACEGPSQVEVDEASEAARWHAGLQTGIKPVTLIGHVDVLARVLRQRTDRTIDAVEAVGAGASQTASRGDGAYGLVSLGEKKRREAEDVAVYDKINAALRGQTHLRVPDAGGEAVSGEGPQGVGELETLDTDVITLSDVAQMATAIASLRYRDAQFWEAVVRMTVWGIRFDSHSARPAESQDGASDGANALMTSVRNVCFALDYVQHANGYDAVMDVLVAEGYLAEAIPPPSQSLRQMVSVKQRGG